MRIESLKFPVSKKEAEAASISMYDRSIVNEKAEFSTRLRELRKKKDISQDALAKALHVTKSTISLYEQGENVPDVKTAFAMAEYFQVPCDYLLCMSDDTRKEPSPIDTLGLSPSLVDILTDDKRDKDTLRADLINAFYESGNLDQVVVFIQLASYYKRSKKTKMDTMGQLASFIKNLSNEDREANKKGGTVIPIQNAAYFYEDYAANTFRVFIHELVEKMTKEASGNGDISPER